MKHPFPYLISRIHTGNVGLDGVRTPAPKPQRLFWDSNNLGTYAPRKPDIMTQEGIHMLIKMRAKGLSV